jgi:NADH dehydrogenase
VTTGAVSCWEVAPRFEELLAGTNVNFVHGDVTAIDTDSGIISVKPAPSAARASANAPGTVTSTSGLSLPYDHAILSMGAGPGFGGVPGAAEFAMPFYSLDDALMLRKKLLPFSRSSSGRCQLAIVGGSYVGVELAANLAEWLKPHDVEITLVHRSEALLSSSEEFSRMVAQSRLEAKGVRVMLETSVQAVSPGKLSLKPSSAADVSLNADLIVWCAGTKPSPLAGNLGLPLDPRGRVRTDAFLAVEGASNLHALGDVAAAVDFSGAAPPGTAQAAMQQADYAAWNTRAALQGTKPLPFR